MSTVTQRSARPGRAGIASAEPSSGAGPRRAALVAVLIILLIGGAWMAGWFRSGVDPRVSEILDLQRQAREAYTANGGPRSAAEATAAVAAMGQIRERIEALPENLRPQVERSGENVFRGAMQARMEAYFSLPPDQRGAELDRQIDQEELMRKAIAAASAVTAVFQGPGGGGSTAGQQAGGNPGGQPGGPPGPGGPGNRSEEERNRWRKEHIIDRTSPEQRAEYTEYRRAMDARREKRGLPPSGPR